MEAVSLEKKFVKDIEGRFHVPSFQRGYRWTRKEVNALLDDITDFVVSDGTSYCLQPLVVRRRTDACYDLLDGQQRLTTIYLIRLWLNAYSKGFFEGPSFSISYETRPFSASFLENPDESRKNENIDFFFINESYEAIKAWFRDKGNASDLYSKVNERLRNSVFFIWYELAETEDKKESIDIFRRLNIGRIPLTSSELVKASLLNMCKGENARQDEVVLLWDDMEKALHEPDFWAFLSNSKADEYQTRLDIVLDLIAERSDDEKDSYFTFIAISQMLEDAGFESVWKRIRSTYLILRDWYEDFNLYHKIGYLIATDTCWLRDIMGIAVGMHKSEFDAYLDEKIKLSIKPRNKKYCDLAYDKDWNLLSRILLLFNVETVRKGSQGTVRFPFVEVKLKYRKNVAWSLEHIHAQNSDALSTEAAYREWLMEHKKSLENVRASVSTPDHTRSFDELIKKSDDLLAKGRITDESFRNLSREVISLLSGGADDTDHSIGNLALLRTDDNAALNNAVFDVKRMKIVEMEKNGRYIPVCTRNVFLKYYSPEDSQIHFWSEANKASYVDAITDVLKNYLDDSAGDLR